MFGKPSSDIEAIKETFCLSIKFPIVCSGFLILLSPCQFIFLIVYLAISSALFSNVPASSAFPLRKALTSILFSRKSALLLSSGFPPRSEHIFHFIALPKRPFYCILISDFLIKSVFAACHVRCT